MTIEEIKAAITEGKKVCFECSSQLVVLIDDWKSPLNVGLGVHHVKQGITMGLPASELSDCFIFGE